MIANGPDALKRALELADENIKRGDWPDKFVPTSARLSKEVKSGDSRSGDPDAEG